MNHAIQFTVQEEMSLHAFFTRANTAALALAWAGAGAIAIVAIVTAYWIFKLIWIKTGFDRLTKYNSYNKACTAHALPGDNSKIIFYQKKRFFLSKLIGIIVFTLISVAYVASIVFIMIFTCIFSVRLLNLEWTTFYLICPPLVIIVIVLYVIITYFLIKAIFAISYAITGRHYSQSARSHARIRKVK